jgi:glycosyltransferase involved in cell wall biosynthesis
MLLEAARRGGTPLIEIHAPIWQGLEDKSRITGLASRIGYGLRWLLAYPGLIWRYLRTSRHDLVFVPYMGHVDVVVLRPLAWLRGARVVWDALLSLHGTVVEDRALVSPRSLGARLLRAWDRLALHCADRLITGTEARARQYVEEYAIEPGRISVIFVGVELDSFLIAEPPPAAAPGVRPLALFYGQFAPLHGLPVVLKAADSEPGHAFDWVFIGTGQEGWRIREWLAQHRREHVRHVEWVPYDELRGWIARADVCLGTFGASRKAATGISNKVFQILAGGRPIVTRDSPAIRELLEPDMPGVYLVPPEDAEALAAALHRVLEDLPRLRGQALHHALIERIGPDAMTERLLRVFASTRHEDTRP